MSLDTGGRKYGITAVTVTKVREFIDRNLFTYDEDGESYNNDVAWELKRALDAEVIDDNILPEDGV